MGVALLGREAVPPQRLGVVPLVLSLLALRTVVTQKERAPRRPSVRAVWHRAAWQGCAVSR